MHINNYSTFTMAGGVISGNTGQAGPWSNGAGVDIGANGTFTMEGGRIYGKAADASLVNSAKDNSALSVHQNAVAAKWGTDGTYTKGGVSRPGGSDIIGPGGTDDTLIAIPAP